MKVANQLDVINAINIKNSLFIDSRKQKYKVANTAYK